MVWGWLVELVLRIGRSCVESYCSRLLDALREMCCSVVKNGKVRFVVKRWKEGILYSPDVETIFKHVIPWQLGAPMGPEPPYGVDEPNCKRCT